MKQGNQLFRQGQHSQALRRYLNGCRFAGMGEAEDGGTSEDVDEDDNKAEVKDGGGGGEKGAEVASKRVALVELLERLRCNAATALQALGRKAEARKFCRQALKVNRDCAKVSSDNDQKKNP